jgi:hypothetical protein
LKDFALSALSLEGEAIPVTAERDIAEDKGVRVVVPDGPATGVFGAAGEAKDITASQVKDNLMGGWEAKETTPCGLNTELKVFI